MTTFPNRVVSAIIAASRRAPLRSYGASLITTDTGEPTASLGRISGGLGGLEALGVSDDFIVGVEGSGWSVWNNRGEPLGVFTTAEALQAGLQDAIEGLYGFLRPLLPEEALASAAD